MADLDTLRPEVREAIRDLAIAARLRPEYQQPVGIIRTELLRLAVENATVRGALETLDVESHKRSEKAEAELADGKVAKNQLENDLANLRCDKLNNEAMRAEANERADAAGERADSAEAKANSWMNQAWGFESELNALRKRIAGSHAQLVSVLCDADGRPCVDVSDEDRIIIGGALRLLVEE